MEENVYKNANKYSTNSTFLFFKGSLRVKGIAKVEGRVLFIAIVHAELSLVADISTITNGADNCLEVVQKQKSLKQKKTHFCATWLELRFFE